VANDAAANQNRAAENGTLHQLNIAEAATADRRKQRVSANFAERAAAASSEPSPNCPAAASALDLRRCAIAASETSRWLHRRARGRSVLACDFV